jgi:hypothetical protein
VTDAERIAELGRELESARSAVIGKDETNRLALAENIRLQKEAAENMEALRMAGEVQQVFRDERDAARAANTPLRERVAALEKLLSEGRDAVIRDSAPFAAYHEERTRHGGGEFHERATSFFWTLGDRFNFPPAVTGTTSDKSAIRQPEPNEPRSCKCGEVTFPDCTFKFWRSRLTGYHSAAECRPVAQ